MWPLVIVLLSTSFCSCADTVPKINLVINNTKPYCYPEVPSKLYFSEELNIEVKSPDLELMYGSCTSESEVKWSTKRPFYWRTFVLKPPMDITSTWSCLFKPSSWYFTKIYCNFDLKFVQSQVMGYILMVNDRKVDTNNLLTDAYRGFKTSGTYYFSDSEAVKISCYKSTTYYLTYYLQLEYVTGNQTFITDPKQNGPVEMYVKLTKDNHGTHIDCIITDNIDVIKQSHVIRLRFELKSADEAISGFLVNGLTLAVNPRKYNEHNQNFHLKYEFYDGEHLEIVSIKDEKIYGLMNCSFSTKHAQNELKNYKSTLTSSGGHYALEMVRHEAISLKCTVEAKSTHDTRSNKDDTITLELVPNTVNEIHDLIGLSKANILVKFNKNDDTTFILYEYIDNHIPSLRCVSSVSKPQWDYQSAEVEKVDNNSYQFDSLTNNYKTSGVKNVISSNYVISGMFKLKDYQTSSVINCTSPKYYLGSPETKSTVVELKRKSYKRATEDSLNNNQIKRVVVIIAAFGTAAVVIVLVVATTIGLRKRKQVTKNLDTTNINYATLPGHKECPMPVPHQWSEENAATASSIKNRSNETNDGMYTKPLPKQQRKQPKGLVYAELEMGEKSEDPAYATVEYEGEETRAQVVLNKARDNYVKVLPSPQKETAKVTSKNQNTTTSSGSPDHNYDNCDIETKKYVNLFDNERYVNAISEDDYAEPAYCEINVKK